MSNGPVFGRGIKPQEMASKGMKSSKTFKKCIKDYLDNRAKEDQLFSEKYMNPKKNLDDCVTYILNTVQKSGCNAFSDDEVFSMAVHYYDEKNIKIGSKVNCKVVVNHAVELTDEEKEEARRNAIKKVEEEQIARLKHRPKKVKKEESKVEQISLFDL